MIVNQINQKIGHAISFTFSLSLLDGEFNLISADKIMYQIKHCYFWIIGAILKEMCFCFSGTHVPNLAALII